jgi:hypothetical protein
MNTSINKSGILLALLLSLFFIAGLICGSALDKGLYLAMNPEVTKAVTEGGFLGSQEVFPTSTVPSDFRIMGGTDTDPDELIRILEETYGCGETEYMEEFPKGPPILP